MGLFTLVLPHVSSHRVLLTGLALGVLLVAGCSSGVLPSSRNVVDSRWGGFDDAKRAFDAIQLGQTTEEELIELGFGPHNASNIRILNYLELIARFMPNPAIRFEDLDPGVRECLAVKTNCEGYWVNILQLDKKREGNAMADLFNFRRRTRSSGWEFDALLMLKHDVVVYKIWSGTPNINKLDTSKNPLGPLQKAPSAIMKVF